MLFRSVTIDGSGNATVVSPRLEGTTTPPDGPNPGNVIGPDVNGDYYKTTDTPNVYEVVDEFGDSKNPEKFVFDTDKDGDPTSGGNLIVKPNDGKWYTENPSGIYREIDANGHPKSDNTGIWVGKDGQFGTTDDKPASKKSDGKWYADMGQNIYYDVDGPNRGELVGGGWDYNPVTSPVLKIFEKNGTYYVGPKQDGDGYNYYYGDADGGNGLVESSEANTSADDVIWYMGLDGNMTTTKPQYMPEGVIKVGDDFWQLIPEAGNGTDIYGKVTVSSDGRVATPVLENGKKLIVDQSTAIPTDKPTTADTRWFDVNDLPNNTVNPGNYDSNHDGYLNPTEYANYQHGIDTAGTTTRPDLYDAGFLVVAYADAAGEITGWNGAGYDNAAYALVVTENAISGGSSTRANLQNRIDKWFYEQCPADIRDAVAGVKFSTDSTSTVTTATGISIIDPGGAPQAFALSAAEAAKWTNRVFSSRTWTRSYYVNAYSWFVMPTNSAIQYDATSGVADIRPAMWVKLTSPSYAVNALAVGASAYDSNSDGNLNATEYMNYQAGITAAGKMTVSAIHKAGFKVVAYADSNGGIIGWNGNGFGGAKYALILSDTAVSGADSTRALMQSRINTWFENDCPANIRAATARVIFANESTSTVVNATGISKVDAGGDIMAFALSSQEANNCVWSTRAFATKTWTRSYYVSGYSWFTMPITSAIQYDATGGTAAMRPAVWVEIG